MINLSLIGVTLAGLPCPSCKHVAVLVAPYFGHKPTCAAIVRLSYSPSVSSGFHCSPLCCRGLTLSSSFPLPALWLEQVRRTGFGTRVLVCSSFSCAPHRQLAGLHPYRQRLAPALSTNVRARLTLLLAQSLLELPLPPTPPPAWPRTRAKTSTRLSRLLAPALLLSAWVSRPSALEASSAFELALTARFLSFCRLSGLSLKCAQSLPLFETASDLPSSLTSLRL